MVKFIEILRRQPKSLLLLLCLLQIVMVGLIDYLTGPDLAFSIFYLFPILAAVLALGQRSGLVLSIISAIAWLVVDLATPRHVMPHRFLNYWNALINLNFFLIVTVSISAVHAARQKQEELIHFVVHDLRSPLSNILMGMQVLKLPEVGELNQAQQEILARAFASGNFMNTLINSLLDLSRLEGGRLKLETAPTAVQEILEDAIRQIALLSENRQIRLQLRNSAGDENINIDRALTVRILVNLLSNAVNYTPAGKCVTLEAETSGSAVTFSVIDQGPGIPREYVAAVFDKYVQVEARRAGALTGSGLGLSFCRLGVQAQGGRIWMESEVGCGTTVRFELPKNPARPDRAAAFSCAGGD